MNNNIHIPYHTLLPSPCAGIYVNEVLNCGDGSGNDGKYHTLCRNFAMNTFGFEQVWFTHSCTGALEVAALLLQLKPGDEVILPSYTYVGTATAFERCGAVLVFADSSTNHPGMDIHNVKQKITPRTRAIILVHYGGMAFNPYQWRTLADENGIFLIEDAAHCIDVFYNETAVGKFGHISAFSFHSTKNISCGEGGMLVINHPDLIDRAGVIMNKGTNRGDYLSGKVNKYEWIDTGSSFVLSEILCAVLWSQFEILHQVTQKRQEVWNQLFGSLCSLHNRLPVLDEKCRHNAHIFYLLCNHEAQRNLLQEHYRKKGITAIPHYQALHNSPYIRSRLTTPNPVILPQAEKFTSCLIRIPCHPEMNPEMVNVLINSTLDFFHENP